MAQTRGCGNHCSEWWERGLSPAGLFPHSYPRQDKAEAGPPDPSQGEGKHQVWDDPCS